MNQKRCDLSYPMTLTLFTVPIWNLTLYLCYFSTLSLQFLRLSNNEAPRLLEAIVEANVKCIFRRVELVYDENHSGPDLDNLCELANHAGEHMTLDLSQIPSNICSTIQSIVDLLTFLTAELTRHDITIPSDATVNTKKIGGNLFGNRGNSKGRNLQGVDSKVLVV
jgi:hypothetical protein